MFGRDEDFLTDFEVRWWSLTRVRGFGVAFLSRSELLLECVLQVVDVNSEIASAGRRDVTLRVHRDVRVVTLVGEEGRNAGRVVRSVVVGELGERLQGQRAESQVVYDYAKDTEALAACPAV